MATRCCWPPDRVSGSAVCFSHSPTLRSVVAVAYLIVFGSLVGFSAYGYLLRTTSPAVATSYAYVNPLVAMALGVIAFAGQRACFVASGNAGDLLD